MSVTIDPISARFDKRVGIFMRRGLAPDTAAELADQLRDRDADFDDRRMCIECAHLQRDGGCFAARQGWLNAAVYLRPVHNMLQRCERFEWQKP